MKNVEHNGCEGCYFTTKSAIEEPCVSCNGTIKCSSPEYGTKPDLWTEDGSSVGDAVEHPSHYNRENAMECIDEMIAVFGVDMVKAFCLLNVWKYRYRAADKNGEEDLKKSDWYLKKYIELGGGF